MKSKLSVLTAASTYDLVTLDDMLLELQIQDPSDSDKNLISQQITEVSIAISNHCDRVFPLETVQETLWLTPDDFHIPRMGRSIGFQPYYFYNSFGNVENLRLERIPIGGQNSTGQIESIIIDDVAIFDRYNLPNVTEDMIFRLDELEGALYRLDGNGHIWYWSFAKTIVITYSAGYNTIPDDLKRACKIWVMAAWFAAGQDPATRLEDVFGIARVQYQPIPAGTSDVVNVGSLPDNVAILLEPYRKEIGFA